MMPIGFGMCGSARSARGRSVFRMGGGRMAVVLVSLVLLVGAVLVLAPVAPALSDEPAVGEGERVAEGSYVDDLQGIGINGFVRLNKGTSRSYEGTDFGYRFPVNDEGAFIVLAAEDFVVVFVPQDAAEATGFSVDDPADVEALMEGIYALDEEASHGGVLASSLDAPVTVLVGEDVYEGDGVKVMRDVAIGDGYTYLTVERTDGSDNDEGLVCCDYGHLVATGAVVVEEVPTWWESLASFLGSIDYRPLWVSLKTSFAALAVVFVLGLLAAWRSLGVTSRWKGIVDTLFTIPMVLPPTVCGFLLLLAFGNASPLGRWLMDNGVKLVFSWPATVIAATVVAFPLMYRTARGAFEALDSNMLDAARTLGWSEGRIFLRLMVPLAWPSIAAGTVLAFARAMGEFGATLFCAGNYAGITQTMPIAIYFQWMGGNTDVAIFWVIVVILISFLVILFINLYSAHSQRYRAGGLTRGERRQLRRNGSLAGEGAAGDEQSFDGISAADARDLLATRESAGSDGGQR